jgi:hypothetical protein
VIGAAADATQAFAKDLEAVTGAGVRYRGSSCVTEYSGSERLLRQLERRLAGQIESQVEKHEAVKASGPIRVPFQAGKDTTAMQLSRQLRGPPRPNLEGVQVQRADVRGAIFDRRLDQKFQVEGILQTAPKFGCRQVADTDVWMSRQGASQMLGQSVRRRVEDMARGCSSRSGQVDFETASQSLSATR